MNGLEAVELPFRVVIKGTERTKRMHKHIISVTFLGAIQNVMKRLSWRGINRAVDGSCNMRDPTLQSLMETSSKVA